mmetsp:Transcript_7406/g.11097  ORF Transcript_7406/g.11097 Transcript_7406/m.11097 type:complete len:112 (+) Transcript_7406:166-501(+)
MSSAFLRPGDRPPYFALSRILKSGVRKKIKVTASPFGFFRKNCCQIATYWELPLFAVCQISKSGARKKIMVVAASLTSSEGYLEIPWWMKAQMLVLELSLQRSYRDLQTAD